MLHFAGQSSSVGHQEHAAEWPAAQNGVPPPPRPHLDGRREGGLGAQTAQDLEVERRGREVLKGDGANIAGGSD